MNFMPPAATPPEQTPMFAKRSALIHPNFLENLHVATS